MLKNSATDPISATEGLCNAGLRRDQVLARLWSLANLGPEATRGSIAGQIKALSMIIAIEELIPGRLPSARPASAVPRWNHSVGAGRHAEQVFDSSVLQPESVTAVAAKPVTTQAPEFPAVPAGGKRPADSAPPSLGSAIPANLNNPFVYPQGLNPKGLNVGSTGLAYDASVSAVNAFRPLSLSRPQSSGHSRGNR